MFIVDLIFSGSVRVGSGRPNLPVLISGVILVINFQCNDFDYMKEYK